jgi:hypothetical protein
VLKAAPTPKVVVEETKKEGEIVGKMSDDQTTTIFTIDISGSMEATVGEQKRGIKIGSLSRPSPRS